jgi:hypothetical protein
MKSLPTKLLLFCFMYALIGCNNSTTSNTEKLDSVAVTSATENASNVEQSSTEEQVSGSNDASGNLTRCDNDVRAYEFGREMYTWIMLSSSGLSLQGAIVEYSESIGLAAPFDASNSCVLKGFEDAKKGIDSPFNPDGNSWTTF